MKTDVKRAGVRLSEWIVGTVFVLIVLSVLNGLLGLLLLSVTPGEAPAQVISPVIPPLLMGQSRTTVDDWQMTGIDSTTAQSVTLPAGTKYLEIQAEDATLRWTSDGTAPTSSVGMIIYAGDTREFVASLGAIQLIATSGTAKANLHGER